MCTLFDSNGEEFMEEHQERASVALISLCVSQGHLRPGMKAVGFARHCTSEPSRAAAVRRRALVPPSVAVAL